MDSESRFSVNGALKRPHAIEQRHRKADQDLVDRYPQMTEKWLRAEDYFRSLHLPHSISVKYNECTAPDGCMLWDELAFVRHKGKWRLCCGRDDLGNDGPPAWKPVVECDTDIRLEAAAHLGELKIEAAKSKEEYVKRIDKALEEIDRVLSD
jgi:hypothetical protein